MCCPFSQFKDLFGVPGTGVHQYKIFDTAIVDYILTIVLAMITTYYTDIPLVLTTIFWFIIAIILHILFGVNTAAVKYLGLAC